MVIHKLFTPRIVQRIIQQYFCTKDLSALDPVTRISVLRTMAAAKARTDPIIKKLETPEFKSLFTDELNTLAGLFSKYDYEIRIAGGAVRDLLMDIKPKDLDFATTATPQQMKDMFTKENIRMINTKGEKHGTITPRINDKENFEITTLRIDITTDGRHAEVQFTTDWMLDANRRDLTINSMFLGLDGTLYDYFYGYEDIHKRRVAFVGDATARIQEDYLRILRYFRFYGRISKLANNHEDTTLEAIRNNSAGLKRISGERIWVELKKILEGNFGGELMVLIIKLGLAQYIGLNEDCDIEELKRIYEQTKHLKLNAITLFSALLKNPDDVIILHERLRLSAFERDMAFFLVEHRHPKLDAKPLLPYQKLVLKSKTKPADTKLWAIEALKYNNSPHLEEFTKWDIPKFPISGNMLKEIGVEGGKLMGRVLYDLKLYWADTDFKLSNDELLKQVPIIVDALKDGRNKI